MKTPQGRGTRPAARDAALLGGFAKAIRGTIAAVRLTGAWVQQHTDVKEGLPKDWVVLPVFGTEGAPRGGLVGRADGRTFLFRNKEVQFAPSKGYRHGLLNAHAVRNLATAEVIWLAATPADMIAVQAVIPADLYQGHVVSSPSQGPKDRPDRATSSMLAGKEVWLAFPTGQTFRRRRSLWARALLRAGARAVRLLDLPYSSDNVKYLGDYLSQDGHPYPDLLGLAEGIAPITRPADVPTEAPEGEGDDPHRLAKSYLDKHHHPNGSTRRCHCGIWYVWDGRAYHMLSDFELQAEVVPSVKEDFDDDYCELVEAYSELGGDTGQKRLKLNQVSNRLINSVLSVLRSLCIVSDETRLGTWLGDATGRHRNYVTLENGVLDIDAALKRQPDALKPHSPLWFSTVCLPYPYEPTARSSTLDRFLARNLEGDAERIALFQEWCGYLLACDTDLQKFMLMEGEGSNGKSVACALMTALAGEGNVSNVPLEAFGERFKLIQTLGKLVNIAAEVGDLNKVAEGHLKAFTAGDRMMFEQKNKPVFSAQPTARLVLATNNRPRFSDKSEGLWRRLILLPFRVQIGTKDRVTGMDKPSWWVATGEMPGVFNWAMEGLRRLRRQGRFTDPSVCRAALDEYRLEVNPARRFLTEHFHEDRNGLVNASQMYDQYRDWCKRSGHLPLADKSFGKEVRRAFRGAERVRRGSRDSRSWCYSGISTGPPCDTEMAGLEFGGGEHPSES